MGVPASKGQTKASRSSSDHTRSRSGQIRSAHGEPAAQLLLPRLLAESFGTFVLVLAVIGTALFLSPATGPLPVAVVIGLAVVGSAYAVGSLSGGHFNPAVTLGIATAGRMPWRDVGPYVAAQVAGGIVASSVLAIVAAGGPRGFLARQMGAGFVSNGWGSHSPEGFDLASVLLVEVVLTAVFLTIILGVTAPGSTTAGFAPIAIGLTLTMCFAHFDSGEQCVAQPGGAARSRPRYTAVRPHSVSCGRLLWRRPWVQSLRASGAGSRHAAASCAAPSSRPRRRASSLAPPGPSNGTASPQGSTRAHRAPHLLRHALPMEAGDAEGCSWCIPSTSPTWSDSQASASATSGCSSTIPVPDPIETLRRNTLPIAIFTNRERWSRPSAPEGRSTPSTR